MTVPQLPSYARGAAQMIWVTRGPESVWHRARGWTGVAGIFDVVDEPAACGFAPTWWWYGAVSDAELGDRPKCKRCQAARDALAMAARWEEKR